MGVQCGVLKELCDDRVRTGLVVLTDRLRLFGFLFRVQRYSVD